MSALSFNLSLTLGPIINGAFFCVFFFGLICMQTINYLKAFPNDIMLIKCTVRLALYSFALFTLDNTLGHFSMVMRCRPVPVENFMLTGDAALVGPCSLFIQYASAKEHIR